MFSAAPDAYPQSRARVTGKRPSESVCENGKPPEPVALGSADFQAAARFRFGESLSACRPADIRAPFMSVSICCSAAVMPASVVSQLLSAFAFDVPPSVQTTATKAATTIVPAAATSVRRSIGPLEPASAPARYGTLLVLRG